MRSFQPIFHQRHYQVSVWQYLVLAGLIFLGFFHGMAGYPLLDNNEGLYAEVAREMFHGGSYVIPHLNYLPYIEKPPLLYWLVAGSFHLFGVSTFAARLVPSLASLFTCLGILFVARKSSQEGEGWLAASIFATSLGIMIIGRTVYFDMLLTACLTWSLVLFYAWYVSDKRHYLLLAYAVLALAVLTKGLLALVIVPGVSFLFMLLNGTPRQKFWRLFDPIGIGIFFLLVLPWHIMASLKDRHFAWNYIVNEQFLRFLHKRIPVDYYTGPIYYYLPRLLIYFFPWSLLLPLLCFRPHLKNTNLLSYPSSSRGLTAGSSNGAEHHSQNSLTLFSWLWFLLPLIFFSISRAKANYYMVIGAPPLAILLGQRGLYWVKNRRAQWLAGGFFITVTLLMGAMGYLHFRPLPFGSPFAVVNDYVPLFFGAYVVLFLLGVVFLMVNRQKAAPFIYLYFGLTIVSICLIFNVINFGNTKISQYQMARFIQQNPSIQSVYLYQDFENISALSFYLGRRLPIVDSVSNDLYRASEDPRAKGWFIHSAQFLDRASQQPVYVVVAPRRLDHFYRVVRGQRFERVETTAGSVLLVSQPGAQP